jgi:hypothetical protein
MKKTYTIKNVSKIGQTIINSYDLINKKNYYNDKIQTMTTTKTIQQYQQQHNNITT